MNILLFVAAILTFLLGAVHSALGERLIIRRLLGLELPKLAGSSRMMRRSVWFAWHLTTVLMWGMAALLLNMSLGTSSFVSARTIIGCIFVACAVLSLGATRGKHFSWVIFGVIAILTLISR
ncbi:MAG TPA: hypothetical protein VK738_20865 [Terriglobales bacterium]|jgi:hypothetical protein|nr:hypothetical protein [Terriglobales bacterium]